MVAATATGRASGVPVEQRVVLRDVRWETYEALLADHIDRSVPHFAFDHGVLEIVTPSLPHEKDNRTLALVVEIVAEELGVDVLNVGSMTFKREDLQRGFEPESSFYIQHEAQVSTKTQIDLTVDPPPDLAIEIEVSNPLLDKLSIYAELGIPEVWRFGLSGTAILRLDGGSYVASAASLALPLLTPDALSRFVAESRTRKRTAWLRLLQSWVRNGGRFEDTTG